MGENSSIEWTTHTFNPWIGCTAVSDGCKHCYAESMAKFRGWAEWGVGRPRQRTTDANWRKPLQWNKAAVGASERPRVFCSSLADVFDPEVDQAWRDDLWALIEATSNLDWLLLTKRPEKVMQMVPHTWQDGLPRNVWIGTSVEHQKAADIRIPELLRIPAVVRFLSCEPLLGPVDLSAWLWEEAGPGWAGSNPAPGIDWVIVGGESGPNARAMHPDWARSLRYQCQYACVAFLFKQWGEYVPWIPRTGNPKRLKVQHVRLDGKPYKPGDYSSSLQSMIRMGKHNTGRLLDGREWNEFPVVEGVEA